MYEIPDLRPDDQCVLDAITEARNELRHQLRRERRWRGTLRRLAKVRAVRGSNTIEGIDVSDDEALAIVDDDEDYVAITSNWRAVRGYSDAMTYGQSLSEEADFLFSEDLLKSLHFMVQGYDLSKRPGHYRQSEVFVRDEDAGKTVYVGPDAELVPTLMSEFVASLNAYRCSQVPPIIQGAMAHLNLVMIHPFADGNGRMSRIMQSLMLYLEQVSEAEFSSIEEYLGRNTQAYYDVLAQVGGGSWSPDRDASAWIEFNLVAHYRQARTAQRRIWQWDRLAEKVDELVEDGLAPQRAMSSLELCFNGYRIRNAMYRRDADVSPTVASRDLNFMVKSGVLQRQGAKRGAWYMPTSELVDWIKSVRSRADDVIDVGIDPYRLLRRGDPLPSVQIAESQI